MSEIVTIPRNYPDFVQQSQSALYSCVRPYLPAIYNGSFERNNLLMASFDLQYYLSQCSNGIGLMVKELIAEYKTNDSIFNGCVEGIMAIIKTNSFGISFGTSWLNFQTTMELPASVVEKISLIQKYTYIYCELGNRKQVLNEILLNIDQNRNHQNTLLIERYMKPLV